MAFLRQIWTLFVKNLLITLIRPLLSTTTRAFTLPVIFITFLAFARNLFIPPAQFGIGKATPIRSLPSALNAAAGGRDKLVFVNSGFTGGDIDRVIAQVATPIRSSGKNVEILSSPDQLVDTCKSSLMGTTQCIAAAVFYSSPSEGPGRKWNYTIKADGGLGRGKIRTGDTDNDAEIYVLPFQHAVDWAIASVDSSNGDPPQGQVMEYPYTSKTAEERKQTIRIRYMGAIIDILAIAFLVGIVGVTYQLTGLVAAERELGMSQLIDCMMPNTAHWKCQATRFIAAHLALDAIYAPGWIVMAIILSFGVFTRTSPGIQVIFQLLAGLSLSSFSLFGASFFRKSQLSGISVTIACLLLGIISQLVGPRSNAGVAILSLLFPPMNYIHFTIFMARWERQDLPTNMIKAAPESPWTIPGIAFWMFCIIQIIVYPVLGTWVERLLHGTQSKDRQTTKSSTAPTAVSLNGFTKTFKPNWFHRKFGSIFGSQRQEVLAVDNLNLDVAKGEIMVLLGANGSGKSTTLDAISGLSKISAGSIAVTFPDAAGGFGLCPQKNVLWDHLTVLEHVQIFNRLKASSDIDTKAQLTQLVADCDLEKKLKAAARTLSGGQKRKLQLAMMFTGGSSVCCVDEVSSGLDPISRRKIWDILLAERGQRTILLTTHFLDEADLLADHIAILSKGSLKGIGSSVELKNKLGSGYRIHVYRVPGSEKTPLPQFEDITTEIHEDQIVYRVPTSSQTADFVTKLEELGISEYRVSGPTIEDVFLKVAEEVQRSSDPLNIDAPSDKNDSRQVPDLLTGKRIGIAQQTWILFRKRATILRRNWLPYLAAFLLPIIAAGLVTLFLKDFKRPNCSGPGTSFEFDVGSLLSQLNLQLVVGPASKISPASVSRFTSSLPGSSSSKLNATLLLSKTHFVNTLEEFNRYIDQNFRNVTPGGFYLGDDSSPPTFAWKGNADLSLPTIVQNALDNLLTNVSISTQYQSFELPFAQNSGKALQLITYFGLALSVYPAFFSLYLTVERLRNVRALHYSNGVRSLPLWTAYLCFDSLIVLAVSVLVTAIFRGVSDAWYHPGYLFVVLFLYGIASTLFSYVVSRLAKSQLAAFAFAAGAQSVVFLLYFIAYLSVLTYAPAAQVDSLVKIVHFVIAALAPIGNITRSLFTALNVFSILCRDKQVATYPGEITLYGGPILYLTLQSIFLFSLLLWWDSGSVFPMWRKEAKVQDFESDIHADKDLNDEFARVSTSNDGLRVLHLSKSFGKFVAVQDVTFGVARGEVFALLGPNGAGKSTTISLIRGDIQPSCEGGEILVENISVIKQRAAARAHLGVCPQFDAMDQMTVLEHLRFYARIRGVSNVEHNVNEVVRAVGLTAFRNRMAAKLSGGNKRKLSLGIALMGNPTVLLLDEPSSGMDAASKRVMWRTLASVVPGRSLVLTTHSMEEADALANRAGIMAKRMLALGTTDYLRRRHGNAYYIHVVHKSAPHTSDQDMENIRSWVSDVFPGTSIEQKTYHGQLRFSIRSPGSSTAGALPEITTSDHPDSISPHVDDASLQRNAESVNISKVFSLLEESKADLGIEFYSVSQTTLDQVFLSIVGKHHVDEEGETS
ncbi:hypothetical protein LOZ61_000205 [Ophidiomyces ophidiicola]|nr:hypothetical protein LOZ61_000205 [Ophidiomyces ophidiicola]KAI1928927.1 hypothetical protein LOZ60_002036 [Ophidiomyces ophidiicola]KAI1956286.1 hypothetical protein LOZ59_004321 [Ophidiomyces ophidiicola]KAI2038137.1 hypothetical protein LOZ48_000082 [Ophidiomyces ophidiicola]KAI2100410.1 hypothetical protein LOZ33_002192 [Ophidiomyces ophidiicola]